MQFTIPQFIEREPRIVGPFTFQQIVYIGLAFALSIFLHFTIKPFFLFLILATLLMGTGFALALLKPGGIPLPTIIKNFFIFLFRPKIYLWGKKALPPKISQPKIEPKKEIKEKPTLKIVERSYLRDLFTRLETKSK